MSIITDALKKAQRERETLNPGYAPSASNSGIRRELLPGTAAAPSRKVLTPMAFISFGILAVALSVFLLLMGRSGKPASEPAEKASTVPGNAVIRSENAPPALHPAIPLADRLSGARPIEQPRKIELTGIMYSPIAPKAVINGRIVTEGSVIDGRTVDRITPESVVLGSGNGQEEIRLQ